MAKEIEGGHSELIFVWISHIVMGEPDEVKLQMLLVFWCMTDYKDIVPVDKEKNEFPTHLMHKRWKSVLHFEVYKAPKDVQRAKWYYDGSLWDIILTYRN